MHRRIIFITNFLLTPIAVFGCNADNQQNSADATAAHGDGHDPDGNLANACLGDIDDGILGTWGTSLLAGGELPNGGTTVSVKATYRFCGSPVEGEYQYTESGLHVVGQSCQHLRDFRGTFSFQAGTLNLTLANGISKLQNCDDASLDFEQEIPLPSVASLSATITDNELTLTAESPVVYVRE